MKQPGTLQEAIIHFADYENCRKFLIDLRWVDGKVRCPRCDSDHVAYLETARLYKCYGKHEKAKFSLKVGTIFEDSALGLEKWLPAMWLVVNAKNGISSMEISRSLGITQKSAWHMAHRIREAMRTQSVLKIGGEGSGPVEMDETYIGGKVKNMHKAKIKAKFHGKGTQGGHGKSVVFGMLERGGQVRAMSVADRRKHSIDPAVSANVTDGAHIITDEADVYNWLTGSYYHEVINHVEGYVREHIHTNGIENFWALLKRGLNGTYVNVEPFHLQAYVEEQVFKFNNRATKENPLNDADRFALACYQIVGKRLTWNTLTGKVASPRAQLN